jgi:biotin transport system substrate-specific component
MSTNIAYSPRVLADTVPGGAVRDIALVAAAAGLMGISAQIAVPLPFTPVPISLGTFTALLAGAALGPLRAGAGLLVYLLAGMAGVPWFSEQASGWNFPSFGYIIGFLVAAVLVGALARRGADRTPLRTVGLMVVGNLVIYAAGVPWLMASIDADLTTALMLGVVPFLIGDAVKIVAAAGLLPVTWSLVHRFGAR